MRASRRIKPFRRFPVRGTAAGGRSAVFLVLLSLLLLYTPTRALAPLQQTPILAGINHFHAPRHNLAEIDYALLDRAKFRIDMAAYVLTDRGIIEALYRAARRKVQIRLYLDPDQPMFKKPDRYENFTSLLAMPNVEVRIKAGRNLMHLKAYQIDGRVLRTGAANFSYSGLRRQDNDLLVLRSLQLAGQFINRFNAFWSRESSKPLRQMPP